MPVHLRFTGVLFASALGVFLVAMGVSTAKAQGVLRSIQSSHSARFIESPRIITQQLREAERSIAEERYSDAVVRLGELLQGEEASRDDLEGAGQDFFVDIDEAGVPKRLVSNSLFYRARRLIGSMPAKGLEIYELRYGPLARRMLDEATAGRDWRVVEEVRRRFFHTVAGYEASMLLAQREWVSGNALGTMLYLEELMQSQHAKTHLGLSLDVLFAAASTASGRGIADSIALRSGEVTVAGQATKFPEGAERGKWLASRFESGQDRKRNIEADFRMLRGAADRNGASEGEMPLANARWELDTTASPRQERTLKQKADEMATRGELPPPSFLPLRVGGQLLMRTTERLVGVDYRTGKRVWQYPWYSAYEGFDEEQVSFDTIPGQDGRGDLLSQRVWNDLPFGQLSSDGDRVFVLDDLGEVEMASFSPIIGLQGTRPADVGRNTLVALDLKTEGKLLWRVGAGEDQPSSLSDAFFLGPPLPLEGRLYVLVEVAGDICLCCLDPRSGSELWRQQLVAVETGGIETDPVRRVSGAMPTYQQGVLLCPTGAGAIVAVDLVDRFLRWGRICDRNAELQHSLMGGNGLDQNQLMNRWYDGAAVAVDDTVLVTPIETDRLYALDLFTGEERFAEKNRVRMRYLAGARDGRVVIVGSNQVRAISLETGEALWTTASDWIPSGQQVSGVGLFGEGSYLVPTTANELIRLSLQDGSVLERRTTRYPLGNLVATGGELISQSPTGISVAYGQQSLEPLVEETLATDPDNFDAMVRKAELLIQSGERDEALEYLARARKIDPDNDEVYILSVSAMLGSLRESPQISGPLVDLLERLIDRPSQRVELLALQIQAGLESDSLVETAKLLVKLSDLLRSETLLESTDQSLISDSARFCTLDSWIEARVNELYSEADAGARDGIDAEIRAGIEGLDDASVGVLQRVLSHFGATESTQKYRGIYTRRMIDAGLLLKAERATLGHQPWSPGHLKSLGNDRLETLGQASVEGGFQKNAMAVFDAIDFEQLVRSSPERANQWSEVRQAIEQRQMDWPGQVSLQWDSQRIGSRSLAPVYSQRVAQTVVTGGPEFAHWKLVSEFQNPIAFRDPNGQLRGVPLDGMNRRDEGDKEAIINGSVGVVVTQSELICIDLYELVQGEGESILWRRDWSGDSGPIAKRRSETTPFDDQVFRYRLTTSTAQASIAEFRVGPILGDRVLMLQGGDLMAVDLFTSETLWRNSSAPRSGVVLAEGRDVLVVSPETNEVARFDGLDGAKLSSKPWEYGTLWSAQNRYVLCYSPAEGNRRFNVRLVDVFSDKVLHELTTDSSSRGAEGIDSAYGRVLDGRYMILLNNRGQLNLWDIQTGRDIGTCQLPAMADLQGLHAMVLDGQLIILPRRKGQTAPVPLGSDTATTAGQSHQTTHGVFAISLEDASLRWSFDDETAWGCTLTQPAETPALLLCRSRSTHSTTNVRKRELDVLAIDVRDGKVLDKLIGKQVPSQTNEIETRLVLQPLSERIIVQIGGELLTYKFGEPEADQATE